MSKENSSLENDSEEAHEPSITDSTSIPSTREEENVCINGEPYSNSQYKSVSVSFEDSESGITPKDINRTSLQ